MFASLNTLFVIARLRYRQDVTVLNAILNQSNIFFALCLVLLVPLFCLELPKLFVSPKIDSCFHQLPEILLFCFSSKSFAKKREMLPIPTLPDLLSFWVLFLFLLFFSL